MKQPIKSLEWLGRTASRRVLLTAEMIDSFASLSGDTSAIHVADDVARARGFQGRIAHGLLLGSLVSAVVGTELPGHAALLQEVKLLFRNPCYIGDCLHISVQVTEVFESVGALLLKVSIRNQHRLIVATGRIQTGVYTGQ